MLNDKAFSRRQGRGQIKCAVDGGSAVRQKGEKTGWNGTRLAALSMSRTGTGLVPALLMPTFQAPLCAAFTLPEMLPVPVRLTGSGVFVTMTGAEPAAPTGLLGTSDSATVKMPNPTAINISLLNRFMLVLLKRTTLLPRLSFACAPHC